MSIKIDNDRGKVGFIKSDKGDFYFSTPINRYFTKDINEGTTVIFRGIPKPNSDKKTANILNIKN